MTDCSHSLLCYVDLKNIYLSFGYFVLWFLISYLSHDMDFVPVKLFSCGYLIKIAALDLFIYIRHKDGSFYPGGDDGSYEKIGEGPGAAYNINVPWENCSCGDADYLAVWDHVLIPVAKAFDPDIIIISAGFDAG